MPGADPSNPPGRERAALADLAARGLRLQTDPAVLEHYGRSTGPEDRPPLAVVHPTSSGQVQMLVRTARQAGLQLHPISGGCNWGYGDACPPGLGQVLVDLGQMNRILEVNTELGYAVIEPGVTQGQLWQHLKTHNLPYAIDATGAGPDSSFTGNTLDRGFGHTRYGDHTQTACGLEVVLGDGRIVRTGFGHYENARTTHVYPYGVGPSLDGLFAQSSLGIVTQMGIWLLPESDDFCAFVFQGRNDDALPDLIDRLAPLRRQGVITSAVHIANDLRLLSARTSYPWDRAQGRTPLPDELRRQLCAEHGIAPWTGCGAIAGPPEVVAATRRVIRRALRGYRPIFLTDRRLAWLQHTADALGRLGMAGGFRQQLAGLRGVYNLLKGQPDGHALAGTLWRVRDAEQQGPVSNPLDHHAGLMWISPVLPMTRHDVTRARTIMEPIYRRHGFEPFFTFTMINERALIGIANIYYDRREVDETRRAHACYDELLAALIDAGYPPYRTGRSGYPHLARGSTTFWDVAADLKRTLDPDRVISPGRYQPDTAPQSAPPAGLRAPLGVK